MNNDDFDINCIGSVHNFGMRETRDLGTFPVFLPASDGAMANICLYQQANRVHCVMHFR